ncbi:hypothetical protein Apa02nite_054170 [Actinoplanes palleronii]|uniref:Uncharacterized protein n=1 Tax=Actinoplanes palleronii TaxID=113570 RepID=A0ABQ4BF53_9ACTN|nr:hypothetical protein Apa02nite_054170 [Actinoplanes palleronii]
MRSSQPSARPIGTSTYWYAAPRTAHTNWTGSTTTRAMALSGHVIQAGAVGAGGCGRGRGVVIGCSCLTRAPRYWNGSKEKQVEPPVGWMTGTAE